MRTALVVGNWKMNGSRRQVAEFAVAIREETQFLAGVDIAVCPPAPFLTDMYLALAVGEDSAGAAEIGLGVQNLAATECGAYTGELAASMLSEFGCDYAIVGHSERRALFLESDQQVADKTLRALEAGLTPIVCVGETLEQREANQHEAVISSQLTPIIDALNQDQLSNIVIAYEPVWAIGTGKTASNEQAQEVHAYIRALIADVGDTIARRLRILYGGSVKPNNAAALFNMPDIDGGLIGGASLQAADFAAICRAAA
jgi:triosephosphate isomerase